MEGLTKIGKNDTNFIRTVGNSVYARLHIPVTPDLRSLGVLVPDDGFPLCTGPVIHFMVHPFANKFIHKYNKKNP